MTHLLILAGCAGLIYLSCEWFLNAVEWLGARLKMGAVAIGSILAAIGTALPESVVTLVAVAFGGGDARKDIGVGAALGGPLVLASIAYGVAGITAMRARRARATEPYLTKDDVTRLSQDQRWFLAIFSTTFLLGLFSFIGKPLIGAALFAVYAVYFVRQANDNVDVASADGLEPLKFQRRHKHPATWAIVAQALAMLVIVFLASQQFVHQLEWLGPKLGLSTTVVALLLSPVATELPETLNAIIWTRQHKYRLALANISGAMMIQATVPAGIAMIFTPWRFSSPLILSASITLLALATLAIAASRGKLTERALASSALFYVVFAVLLATVVIA